MKTREQIRQVKKKVEMELLKNPGVTGVDIGYKTVAGKKTDILAIIIYVERKHNVSLEKALPKIIDGVPVDIVQRFYKTH